jgi:alkanesulfonate monooxygenase SsuD/methylene tetrahydromethanopterin reductase-like flavin-dependent oxidoreductase (luciferase family)
VPSQRNFEQTQLAEDFGYHAVWFVEHHYSVYSFGSPAVMSMAAAAHTERIRLGAGAPLIPSDL